MEEKKKVIRDLGIIQLNNNVFVTDPCYDTTTWCQKLLTDVAPGEYRCFVVISDVGSWENRVFELHVVKKEVLEKYKALEEVSYRTKPLKCCIGVDSGQCGIFDALYYIAVHPDGCLYDDWYDKICNLTSDETSGTVDGVGVVTSSGYGDGSYPLYTMKDEGQVVAMKVVFISE